MEYEYDKDGVFGYFAVTMLALVLVPATARHLSRKKTKKHTMLFCGCDQCVFRSDSRDKTRRWLPGTWLSAALSCGWLVLACVFFAVATKPRVDQSYNPYEVLGVSTMASEDAVRRQFRRLSIRHHPDKVPDEKKEEAQEVFMKIQRAYQTLTNEEQRKNWEEYGNPDGRITFSIGIALPAVLVSRRMAVVVIALYLLSFFVLLPRGVQRVWRWLKRTGQVERSEMSRLYKKVKENTTERKIIVLLSGASEFEQLATLHGRSADAFDSLLAAVQKKQPVIMGDAYEKPKEIDTRWKHVVYVLLLSHFFREPTADPGLRSAREKIVVRMLDMAAGVANIASIQGWSVPMQASVTLSSYLIQGLWGRVCELQQLPYVDAATAIDMSLHSVTCEKVREMDLAQRKEVFPLLSDRQLQAVGAVSKSIPVLKSVSGEVKENSVPSASVLLEVTVEVEEAGKQLHHPYFPEARTPFLWILVMLRGKTDLLSAPKRLSMTGGKTVVEIGGPWSTGCYEYKVVVLSDTFVRCNATAQVKVGVSDPVM